MLLLPRPARADVPWLSFRGSAGCSVERDELASRILEAVAGARDPALAVQVDVADGPDTLATVQLVLGSRVLGVKQLEAPTCDEALDAIVAVVALALSSSAQEQAHAPPDEPARATAVATWAEAPIEQNSGPADGRARSSRVDGEAADETKSKAPSWRVLAGIGVDTGTLAQPTAVVGGGAALTLARAELRAMGRYGVPSTREELSVTFESVRTDFGAATLDCCWGLDRARWVSACAGLELSLKRSARVELAAGEPRVEKKTNQPTFGPVAGLAFVLRDVLAQPHLELSAQLPVLGKAPALGFRASLGGGVMF
jgi:hypothetical protein